MQEILLIEHHLILEADVNVFIMWNICNITADIITNHKRIFLFIIIKIIFRYSRELVLAQRCCIIK